MANAAISDTLSVDNAQVLLDTGDNTAMSATVTGTFVGTITFQVIYDAVEGWVSAPCFTRAGVGTTSTVTAPGSRFINVAGALSVRALMHPFTSGTAEVTFAASPAISVAAASGGGGGGAATIADGADVAEGSTTDTAVTGDNSGTVNAHLRGLTKVSGDPADTKVVTDVAGTLSAKLRGLVAIFADVWNSSLHYLQIGGVAPAGSAPSGNPVSVAGVDAGGLKRHLLTDTTGAQAMASVAIAHGTNPTAIAAGLPAPRFSNRAGVPFIIGGHPNIVCFAQQYTAAQTDTAVVTVAAGLKLVVTGFLIVCSNANTVNVSCRLGFGTANVPAYNNAGLLGTHPNIGPGSGFGRGGGTGIIGVGADDADLRFTCSVPTGGAIDLMVLYHTIES
jgi:hypothetical protein